jgi:hypothetical protein
MKRESRVQGKSSSLCWLPAAALAVLLAACGGGSSSGNGGGPVPAATTFEAPPATARTVTGAIDNGETSVQPQSVVSGTVLTLNGSATPIPLDPDGRFEIHNLADGNHSLLLRQAGGTVVEIPFRMLEGRSLSLGTVMVHNGTFEHTGFNGFRFGFVDDDGDGSNDLCADLDGNGVCDPGSLYAGYPYFMEHGFVDGNRDRINDHFRDANCDGVNDLDDRPFGPGFGFVDVDGDGIDDRTGMPFRHPFGFVDSNGDGVNDAFVDADGDGVNDLTGVPYVGMPGWADLNSDGINDFFCDTDGDGINDLTGLPYGHGFGWVDVDGDGVNDRFRDANGDGVNDVAQGPLAGMAFHIGFCGLHTDADGDGIDDGTGFPYHHGFGWVDLNGDGVNDAFADANGDGINDLTGHHYDQGYMPGPGGTHDGQMGTGDWPMGPQHGGGMM